VILNQSPIHNLEPNLTAVQTSRIRPLTIRPRRYKDFVCKRIDKAPEQHQINSDVSVLGSEVTCECGVVTDEMNLVKRLYSLVEHCLTLADEM
jgi:hypothetical protein